jgi:DNA modification methylase
MYKTMTGKPVSEQVEAFCDTWEMDAEKERVAKEMPVLMREYGIDDYYVEFWRLWIQALRHTQPHLLAYLVYMVERLLHMKVLLRPTGSIYLHCDPTASHYIKVMMDGIFGHKNFRSEVIWKRSSSHNRAKRWGPVHDTIFHYTKTEQYTWNRVLEKYSQEYLDNFYNNEDKNGRYRVGDLTGPGKRGGDSGQVWKGVDPNIVGRHWEPPHDRALPEWFKFPDGWSRLGVRERLDILDDQYLIYWPKKEGGKPRFKGYLAPSGGIPAQDVITDINPTASHSSERLGYPTQKPIALLDRIIQASSNKGDVVFDPFCGCGTTIYSAHKNNRKWIGCDIAILAIKLIKHVLEERSRLNEGVHFEIDGIPASVEQAQELFKRDPFQFEHWIVERVGAFPTKKTGDKGIDGRMYFETKDRLVDMVLSVKGGTIRPTDIRDLRGVLERETNAELAGFISNKTPSKAMREEASIAGTYEYSGVHYDRIQLLTIQEIIEEKRHFHTPSIVGVKEATGQLNLPV